MAERTVVITGASDGIGAVTARRLHARGDEVVVVGRSPERTARVARSIGADHHVADFGSLSDVRELATALSGRHPRIDVPMNNAGGIMGERQLTEDGNERTLQVNHLAPFLLTNLLMPTLVASRARVISTASVAARYFGRLDLSDLQVERDYSPERAYGNGKLENILFSSELHRRFHRHGLETASFHPGNVATSFSSESTSILTMLYRTPLRNVFLISPEKGADTMTWLATSDEWTSGAYYEKRRIARTNPQALDPDLAAGLWARSEELVRPWLTPLAD